MRTKTLNKIYPSVQQSMKLLTVHYQLQIVNGTQNSFRIYSCTSKQKIVLQYIQVYNVKRITIPLGSRKKRHCELTSELFKQNFNLCVLFALTKLQFTMYFKPSTLKSSTQFIL